MRRVHTIGLLLTLVANIHSLYGQDTIQKNNPVTINGYIKNLQTFTFDKNFQNLLSGNLLHNRINIKWKPSLHLTAALEVRNRLFWGEDVNETPGLNDAITEREELLDLSKTWIRKSNFLLHTDVERLWFEYRKPNWNVRLGRQRINWGMTTTWNPNDIFNTYNFLDFDYEERPGSDAVKAQYLVNDFSNIELAASSSGKKGQSVIAAKYFLNKWKYDMQILAGIYHTRPTAGIGWAGSLGEAGFKGEAQFFFRGNDSAAYFNGTIESDYVFNKGWYVNGSLLYNSNGLNSPVSDWSKIDFSPSPLKLMPARWNIVLSTSKEFNPLLSARVSIVYSAGMNLVIFLPSFSYSVAENFTADLTWQSFFTQLGNHLTATSHRCFLRMKWNF